MGLPQPNRLKSPRVFREIYRRGDRHRGTYFNLTVLPNQPSHPLEPLPPSQIGIAVSLKISKKAVIRNRIKRQVRAIFLEIRPWLQPGWRVIISARPAAVECKYEHFLRELKQLLINAEVIKL